MHLSEQLSVLDIDHILTEQIVKKVIIFWCKIGGKMAKFWLLRMRQIKILYICVPNLLDNLSFW